MANVKELKIELLKLEIEHKKKMNYLELRQKFSEVYSSIRKNTPQLEIELNKLGKELFNECFK